MLLVAEHEAAGCHRVKSEFKLNDGSKSIHRFPEIDRIHNQVDLSFRLETTVIADAKAPPTYLMSSFSHTEDLRLRWVL